jgi:hypothetical protein
MSPEALPRRYTHEWYALISALQSSHPDLARRVQDALIAETAPEPLPTEAEIESERRRTSILRGLARFAFKPHPMMPRRTKTNRGAVLLAVVIGVFALWAMFSLHHRQAPVTGALSPSQQAQAPSSTQAPRTESPAPQGQRGSSGTPPQASPRTAQQGPSPQSLLPPLTPPLPSTPPSGPGSGTATPPPSLSEGTTAGGGTSPAPVVSPAAEKGPLTAQIIAPKSQEASLSIASPGASQQGQGGGAPGGGAVPQGQAPQPATQAAGVQIVAPQAPPSQGQQGTQPQQEGQASQQGASQAPSLPSFKVGDQFTVKMLTPLAVSPAWQAIPAVAQAVDGPIAGWRVIGTASMGQDGSIQIAWTQALAPDGKTTLQLHGIAYDPKEGKPGVPNAQTQVMAPQVARTVLASTLQAVNQYVQAQLQAQQTVVSGLTATITSQVPPFWQILAQQLATGFQPPQTQSPGTIVVARIPEGTQVVVFITAP